MLRYPLNVGKNFQQILEKYVLKHKQKVTYNVSVH